MANIMSLVKLRNKPSRDAYDLSRKVAMSAKISELIPVDTIECIPGDRFKIRKQHFTRTMPVQTAAFTRIREYYDWFFVPTNLLWNKFNTFVTQMTDNNQKAASINEDASTGYQHPYFTTTQVLNHLNSYITGNNQSFRSNFFGYDRPLLSCKLLDYLGYGSFYGGLSIPHSTDYVSPYPSAPVTNSVLNPFPLLAYQKIYQDYFRNSQWEKAYSPACNIDYMNDKDDLQIPINNIDVSAENMFDLRYCNWNKDYFMGVLPNSQYGDEASVDLSSLLSPRYSQGFSILSNPSVPNSTDVKTSSSGSLSVGSISTWQLSDSGVERLASAMGLTSRSLSSAFTILALRQAEAAQKWREITQSSQQDYKSQVEAHFGVTVSDAYSDRCQFVDGQVSTIDINEVVNQSLNGDSQAEIKGKGVGTGDGFFEFEAKVHGYLMCIYHAIPILDYQTAGIKKTNLKTMVTDYAIPEFDKTGMVKIPLIELTDHNFVDEEWGFDESISDRLLGYAPQYYEYKTRYDEVKGAFAHGGLDSWVAPFDQNYLDKYMHTIFAAYGDLNIEYHFFKINPNVVNPIFITQLQSAVSDENPSDDILASSESSTDQLLINCSLDVKAVRNLDRNGLPY